MRGGDLSFSISAFACLSSRARRWRSVSAFRNWVSRRRFCSRSCAFLSSRCLTRSARNRPPSSAGTTQSLDNRAKRAQPRDVYAEMAEELVEDYGERVKRARTAAGMTLEQLGEKLKTRRDTLAKVESGSYHPEEALIKKLEREFNIKL